MPSPSPITAARPLPPAKAAFTIQFLSVKLDSPGVQCEVRLVSPIFRLWRELPTPFWAAGATTDVSACSGARLGRVRPRAHTGARGGSDWDPEDPCLTEVQRLHGHLNAKPVSGWQEDGTRAEAEVLRPRSS